MHPKRRHVDSQRDRTSTPPPPRSLPLTLQTPKRPMQITRTDYPPTLLSFLLPLALLSFLAPLAAQFPPPPIDFSPPPTTSSAPEITEPIPNLSQASLPDALSPPLEMQPPPFPLPRSPPPPVQFLPPAKDPSTITTSLSVVGAANDVTLPLFLKTDKRKCKACALADRVLSSPAQVCGCVYPMIVNVSLGTDYNLFHSTAARTFLISFANAAQLDLDQVVLLQLGPDPHYGALMTIGILPIHGQEIFIPENDVTALTALLYSSNFRSSPDMGTTTVLAVSPPAILITSNVDTGGSGAPSSTLQAKTHHMKNSISTKDFIVLTSIIIFVLLVVIALISCALVHHQRRKRLRRELSRIPMSIRSKSTDDFSSVSGWMWGLFPPIIPGAKRSNVSFSLSAPGTPRRLRRFSMKELKDMTGNFGSQNLLGEGGFGRVYKATQDGMAIAAIKKLEPQKDCGEKDFWREVEVMCTLQHPNLVRLLGYCSDSEHMLLAYELCPRGSLQDNIYAEDLKSALNWDLRLKIALGAGRGLQYLHENRPPIVHRDFKSSNVLLDDRYNAKVSDFGLARLMPQGDQRHVSTRVLGTFGYVAPEYVMTGQLTTKSDVYSYGVVLLELITGRTPVDMNRPAGEQSLVTWASPFLAEKAKLLEILDPDLQGRVDTRQLAQLGALAAICVQSDADYRPLMSDVVAAMEMLGAKDNAFASSPPHHPAESSALAPLDASESDQHGIFEGLSPRRRSNVQRFSGQESV